ncbi:aspartate racemase subfamily protein [Candidatus Vecturithrix granuli]|uniref:Aspartate racemase subfamily protein n=1 Tax=Vecturithrix granuli TaxID=1499967 RepID=A0A081BTT3_VECG1|nr:aspartate racemase subfamily protein [Candidatus Vecturithrix granuli]
MINQKFVGVLGGMGPDATVTMFQNILRATPAHSDQEHLRLLVYNNPKIPDRTAAICAGGPDPLPALIESARLLERAGVDLIVIPCVTAHYFYDGIQAAITVPVLHIVQETLKFASSQHPDSKKLGLLSTMGTMQTGLFPRFADEWGATVIVPPEEMIQNLVMRAIYRIKAGEFTGEPSALLQQAATHLIQAGAQAIIAGCTEIPLALRPDDVSVPFLDPMKILAQAVVAQAMG